MGVIESVRSAIWQRGYAPPNTRVQRTRSSPSALRSPLTRYPLGVRWGRMRAPEVSLPARGFPVWRFAGVGNEMGELVRSGVSVSEAVVAHVEVSRVA